MDLLAYWRIDNYWRDLDEGAGFNFNSKQQRLHTSIDNGEILWLFTRFVNTSGVPEYRILAKLIVRAKTINPPSFKYGPYRIWGDISSSQYYKVTDDSAQDVFELLRSLPLFSKSFRNHNRNNLPQAAQTIRALKPDATKLLNSFCAHLPIENRARAVLDESKLERAYSESQAELASFVEDQSLAYSVERRSELINSYSRNRKFAEKLIELYLGRCQVCLFDSRGVYSVDTAEAHHIIYRSRGGLDEIENLVLVCPNHHTLIHRTDAVFDYKKLSFQFSNGRIEPLCLNYHIKPR